MNQNIYFMNKVSALRVVFFRDSRFIRNML